MNTNRYLARTCLFGILLMILTSYAYAMPLTNGDFEIGDLTGWSVVTTTNGTVGGPVFPDVVPFPTSATGSPTPAARFRVGQKTFDPTSSAGGKIQQTTWIDAHGIRISADIAVEYTSPIHQRNLDAGSFDLLLDDSVVDTYAFGPISSGSVLRSRLFAYSSVVPGFHTIGIQITRSFLSTAGIPTPFQYIDNVSLAVTSTPEPATIVFLGSGLIALAAWRWHMARDHSCSTDER